MNRRKLIGSLGFILAAPAIVRVASLMPVKVDREEPTDMFNDGWTIGDSTHFSAEAFETLGPKVFRGVNHTGIHISVIDYGAPEHSRKAVIIPPRATLTFNKRTGQSVITYA